jgi:hypothetical protein
MIPFNYTGLADGQAIKLAGPNVQILVTYTGATDLVFCVKAGPNPDTLAEIVDSTGAYVTRTTIATGAGSTILNISGLTGGTWVAPAKLSGTGSITGQIITSTL